MILVAIQLHLKRKNRGLNFNFGLHYQTMLSSKLELQAGMTISPQANLTSKNERVISRLLINNLTGAEEIKNRRT